MVAKHVALFTLWIVLAGGRSLTAQSADAASPAAAGVDFSVFFAQLEPYGEWVLRGEYGWTWRPSAAAVAGWRPYSAGHWAMADDGWTWMSDEPFGWVVYHYGRWIDDPDDGWLWLPGYQWGPAWVAWRAGDGFIGWAPLPPEDFDDSVGAPIDQPPNQFCFVQETAFLNPVIVTFILPPSRNVTLIKNTTYIFNRTAVHRHRGNAGVSAGLRRSPGDVPSLSIPSIPRQSTPFTSAAAPRAQPAQAPTQPGTPWTRAPQQRSTSTFPPPSAAANAQQRATTLSQPSQAELQARQQRDEQARDQQHQAEVQAQRQREQQQRQAELQAQQQRAQQAQQARQQADQKHSANPPP